MQRLQTPGVHLRWAQRSPAPRARSASITGFVGLAARGPLNSPQRLDHWGQYETVFGGFTGGFRMASAVYGYFANGGRVCHVVRVADTVTPSRRPEKALWVALRGDGTPVLDFHAADEGTWGNDMSLTINQAREPMTLTRLSESVEKPSSGTETLVRVESTADLYPRDPARLGNGSPIVLVHAEDSQIRVPMEVISIGGDGLVHLSGNLNGTLPAHSLVMGYGIDVEVQSGDRLERFESLSLDPDHPRYLVQVINGPDGLSSYVDRMDAGRSILVRVLMRSSEVGFRPLRGVDVRSVANLPASFLDPNLQADLPGDFRFEERPAPHLVFSGVMTEADRERLLEHSIVTEYRAEYHTAIDLLFERSQTFGLESVGRDPGRPFDVGFFTGYADGGYFPDIGARFGNLQGLAALEAVDEIGLIAIPDLADGVGRVWEWGDHVTVESARQLRGWEAYVTGQRQMLAHCRVMGERFAILDAPLEAGAVPDPTAALVPDYVESLAFDPGAYNGALYFPWLRMSVAAGHDSRELVPPCGVVAGVYARTEAREGVHLSPANETLEGVYELQLDLDNTRQGVLNASGINCLRVLPGIGIRIWGARTLSRNTNWRYVAVRRTLLAITREIRYRLNWAVFEPNTTNLRIRVAASLNSYFAALFRNNVLAGVSPEEGFFVKCDAETTPNEVLERGEVIAEVGFAPLYPAEFIIVTIKRTAESVQIEGAEMGPNLTFTS